MELSSHGDIFPDDAVIVSRASSLIPYLRSEGAIISKNRSQTSDLMKVLRENGLMELMRPRRFGGAGYGFDTICRVGRELGRGDASTAWAYMVTAAHDVFVDLYPQTVQAEYWSSERPVGASSYAPTGKAGPAEGGFMLNGKWSFCSGIDMSGWCLVGAIVGMLENPTRPDLRFFLLEASQYQIIDDWYAMGLAGTGSKSIRVDDIFVPDARVLTLEQLCRGHSLGVDAPGYEESVWVAIGYSLAAPAPGAAEMAYEAVVTDLKARFERHDPVFEAKKAAVQSHVAEAAVLIETAGLLLDRSLERTVAAVRSGKRMSDEQRVTNRRDAIYAVRTALKAVDILMSVGGARVLNEDHPVQRAMRDIYAIAAHPATGWDSVSTSFGSVALGGRPTEIMI